MRMNKIISRIVFAVILMAFILPLNCQSAMAAEKMSKKDFVAKYDEESEIYNLYENMDESGDSTCLFAYDKNFDHSKEGVIKTYRGISISSTEATVVKKYGKVIKTKLAKDLMYNRLMDDKSKNFKPLFKNVKYVLVYKYTEKTKQGDTYNSRIHFYIDNNKKVTAVAFSRIRGKSVSDYLYYKDKGDSYYHSYDCKNAIEYYKQALKRYKEDARIYNNLGNCYMYLYEYEEAIIYYAAAIELKPNDAVYLGNMGDALCYLYDYENAIVYLDKAIQLAPNYTHAYILKGDALFGLYRFDEAIEYYDKALKLPLEDASYVYYSKGSCLYGLGKYEEAIKAYDMAIEKDPNYIDAINNKGSALNRLEKYDEACKMFDKVLELKPGNAQAYNGKGNSSYLQKKYKEAIEYYDKAISADPTYITAYYNKANTLYDAGNYTDCITLCDKMIGVDANLADFYYIKSKAYAVQKKEAEYLENLKKAVELDKSFIEYAKTEVAFDSFKNTEQFMKIIADYSK